MANLIPVLNDQIEVLIDPATGESWVTVTGYARMSGLARSTICDRALFIPISLAQVPAEMGSKVRLLDEATVADWLRKDNPALSYLMAQAGTRLFLHQLAGFKVNNLPAVAQPNQPPETPAKAPTVGTLLVQMAQSFLAMEGRVEALAAKVEAL